MPTNDDRRAAEARAAKIRSARDLIAGNGIKGLALDRLLGRIDAMERAVLDTTTTDRECAGCGERFSLGAREASFYADRGWGLPLRCTACRRTRRHREIERAQAPPY
jgi:hypothetical protein